MSELCLTEIFEAFKDPDGEVSMLIATSSASNISNFLMLEFLDHNFNRVWMFECAV